MINRGGLNGLNRNLSKPRGSQDNLLNQLNSMNNRFIVGRVTDIILDDNHPNFNQVGGYNGIGTIFYELDTLNSPKDSQTAKPLHPQNKTFPLINEMVLLFNLPDALRERANA